MQKELVQFQKSCWTTIFAFLIKQNYSQFYPREMYFITDDYHQKRLNFWKNFGDLTCDDWLDMFKFADK